MTTALRIATLAALPAVLLLWASPPARAQETLAAGSPIAEALAADLTEDGFGFILDFVADFIPPDLVIGAVPPSEVVDLFICQETLELDNVIVHTDINSMTIDATPFELNLVVDLDLWLNTPDDPAIMELGGCIEYVCLLHTDPANIVLSIPLSMALSADDAGDPFVDVSIGALSHNIESALANKVHMTGCAIGEINEFLSDFGLNIFDLVIGQFVGEIEAQINDQTAGLEVQVEDALRALWLQDSTAILDTELTYDLHPTAIDHNDSGLRFVLGGSLSTTPAQCVAGFEDDGSVFTPSNLPAMTATVPGSDQGYHAAALVSDDFVNQAMHALWRGGVMCFVVEDLGSAALTTTYLGLLVGLDAEDRLVELLGEDEVPMLVRTVLEAPPLARFDGPHDIDVEVTGLNIEFYPLIQGRFARLASVAVDVAAGVDIGLAPDDALQIDVYLDTEELNPRVTYNEIAPDLNEVLEANFSNFLGVVIDTVAGSYLEGITMAMPTFSGLGLVGLDVLAVGESPTLLDFLGAYAVLGETTGGEGSGCDSCGDTGGCGGDSCAGGDSCLGEEGCGGEEGCDVEGLLADSGCSGEATEQPEDIGCQGCRLITHRESSDHWRITLGHDGAHHSHGVRRLKVGLPQTLLVIGPFMVLFRRRRSRGERARR